MFDAAVKLAVSFLLSAALVPSACGEGVDVAPSTSVDVDQMAATFDLRDEDGVVTAIAVLKRSEETPFLDLAGGDRLFVNGVEMDRIIEEPRLWYEAELAAGTEAASFVFERDGVAHGADVVLPPHFEFVRPSERALVPAAQRLTVVTSIGHDWVRVEGACIRDATSRWVVGEWPEHTIELEATGEDGCEARVTAGLTRSGDVPSDFDPDTSQTKSSRVRSIEIAVTR